MDGIILNQDGISFVIKTKKGFRNDWKRSTNTSNRETTDEKRIEINVIVHSTKIVFSMYS